MTRIVVGAGCLALALGLIVYAIIQATRDAASDGLLPLGLALFLLLAGFTALHRTARRGV